MQDPVEELAELREQTDVVAQVDERARRRMEPVEAVDESGEVTVRLEKGGRIVNGHGADTDIISASAKAYLNALNHFASGLQRAHPQAADV